MKILIVGTGSSQFVKEPIEFVLLEQNSDDEIFVTYNKTKSSLFLDFYEENGIKIIDTHNREKFLSKIPKVGVIYNIWSYVHQSAKENKFDVIHMHSMNNYAMTYFVTKILRKYCHKLICTFYGSDLLLRNNEELKKFEKLLDNIDAFSMASNNLILKFQEAFGHNYDEKINKVPFGLSNLTAIDKLNLSKQKCKESFCIKDDKTVISIGHNTCREQQHIEVIESIKRLPQEIKERIALIFQLTYGSGTEEYIEDVKQRANSIGCQTVFLEKYMNGQEIATLVKATDIYINAQISDAMSGAMLEYLYSGTTVINPSWLNYDELNKLGCSFYKYDEFEQLVNIIEKIIDREEKTDMEENFRIIKNLSHWDIQRNKWKDLLIGGQ